MALSSHAHVSTQRILTTFLAVATLLSSMMVGISWAAGPAASDWKQFCNGGDTQCSGGGWRNGDLNKNNSQFVEGESVPQRLLVDLNDHTGPLTLTFTYATSKGTNVAYDYLTSWDWSEGGLLTGADEPIPNQGFSDSMEIPVDPGTLAQAGPGWFTGTPVAAVNRQLKVQNASITSIAVTSDPAFATSSDSESSMVVVLVPDVGATQVGVVFGAHISSQLDWVSKDANPSSPFGAVGEAATASAITGSPYHVDVVLQGGGDHPLKSNAVIPYSAIDVTKSLSPTQSWTGSPAPGDKVAYQIVATNTGNAAGTVDITDTLGGPGAALADVTAMSYAGGLCTFAGDSGSCPAVSVPGNGGAVTITVEATIGALTANSHCGDLVLTNVAGYTIASGPVGSSAAADVTIAIPTCADLTIDKDSPLDADDDDSAPVPASGTSLSYTITVANSGGQAAPDVTITDTPGSGVAITAMTPTAGACADGGGWACTFDVLANGSVTIDVIATLTRPDADACGDYTRTNTTAITGAGSATVTTSSDVVTLNGTVTCVSDISVVKGLASSQSWTGSPEPGDTIVYEIVATNSGHASGTVDVTDTLSGGGADIASITSMEISATDCTGGTLGAGADSGTCSAVSVPAQGSTTVVVTVTVDASPPADLCRDPILTNTGGPLAGAVDVTIDLPTCSADIGVVKRLAASQSWTGSPEPGDTIVYEIVATNSGYASGTVDVTDTLIDAGDVAGITSMEIGAADCTGGTLGAGADSGTCSGVNVPAQDAVTIVVTVTIDTLSTNQKCADLTIGNRATPSVDGDNDTTNNRAADVTVEVPACADLAIDKASEFEVSEGGDGQLPTASESLTYTITVTNSGGQVAQDVDITDIPGAGVVITNMSGASCADETPGDATDSSDWTCTFDVPANDGVDDGSVTITVTASFDRPVPPACGPYARQNGARIDEVDGAGAIVTTSNDGVSLSGTVDCNPDASITKSILSTDGVTWMDADTVGSGPTLTLPATAKYKVEVTNTGDVDLFHVDLVDHVDPLLDETGEVLESENFFELGSACLRNVDEEDEVVFDGTLAVGETIACFFEAPAELGNHFDVVELLACFPDVFCDFPEQSESPSDDFQEASVRPNGSVTGLAASRTASFVALLLPTVRITGSDPAHYNGVLPPPPPPPPSVDAPSINLAKQGSTSAAPIGATVQYVYTVTNNGDVALSNVTLVDVVDAGSGDVTLVLAAASEAISLAPGASRQFTSSHTVTEADLGQIINTATVTGTTGAQTVSSTDDWLVQVAGAPALSVAKTADSDFVTFRASEAAPVITYTYVVTNTGDVTITGISAIDDVLGVIDLATTTLAPGASVTGTATHTLTRADADAGFVINVVVVTGVDPTGAAVEATDTAEVGVAEVLGEVEERPDPAPVPLPAPDPAPEVLPQVEERPELPATGTDLHFLTMVALLAILAGGRFEASARRRRLGHDLSG